MKRDMNLGGEYLRLVLGCAFLAPNILVAILDGRHADGLTVKNCRAVACRSSMQRKAGQ
jgi:hypothetical protein